MIEAFVRIVDRLISLLEIGHARRRTLLVEVLEPIFKDLEEIHREYLVVLSSARAHCSGDIEALGKVLPGLQKRRLLKEPERERLIATCDRLLESQWRPEVKQFLVAVRSYFSLRSPIADLVESMGVALESSYFQQMVCSAFTGTIGALQLIEECIGRRGIQRSQAEKIVLEVFDSSLVSLRGAWGEVAGSFAEVKAKSL